MTDELSELVQVALPIRSDAQLPDATVKLLCSLKWILLKTKQNRWVRANVSVFLCKGCY